MPSLTFRIRPAWRSTWPGLAVAWAFACAAGLGPTPEALAADRVPLQASATWPTEDPDGARVIVKYKAAGSLMRAQRAAGASVRGPQHAATLGRRTSLALRDGRIIDSRSQVLHGDKGLSSAALAARLRADPEVEYAVPDQRRQALAAPNDPLYAANTSISPAAGQWYLHAPDATFVSAINAEGAWAISTGSASVVVADADTGVLFDHPDLVNKLYPGYDFIMDRFTAGDGGGRDNNAADPGDWVSAGDCGRGSAASASSWHGTKTSSLIGAQTGNGVGMASVGYNVKLLPVRVLGKCGGYDSDIIAGMLWAAGVSNLPTVNPHPARVINLSLGGSGSCDSAYIDVMSQLTAAGVVVVAAAGNDAGLPVGVPANCPGVIAVAGVRHVGTKVGFSNVGPEVAIAAPGGNCVNTDGGPCLYPILSATNTGRFGPVSHTYSDGINPSVGTSFATPLVAGTAALMLSVNPSLTPAQVKGLLMSSARPFPGTSTDPTVLQCQAPTNVEQLECLCTTATCGAGLLDAAAAVGAAAAGSLPVARISASATSVSVGAGVTFNGSASTPPSARSIAFYSWSLSTSGAVAAFSGPTNAASATVVATAPGSYSVELTVTDSAGAQGKKTASVTVLPSDFDRVANWAEVTYPQYFPKPGTAGVSPPYTYRYYPGSGNYLGFAGGRVYLHNGRDWILLDVGALSDFLVKAVAAGF